jgi:hypothetical protein
MGALHAEAQTRLRISTITPGTEKVQLVYNGDFQFQGPLTSGNYPFPEGWVRFGDMFAENGANLSTVHNGVVALAHTDAGTPACGYSRAVTLQPNTSYVLSAYLWNMGDALNHVTTVIDLNDAPLEPQITLSYADANAAQGYFVYRTFNTANTGPAVTLRVFYDGLAGTGASATYFPLAAQWDNVAITKASDFIAPLASGAGGNLRPMVTITNLKEGANIVLASANQAVAIVAAASDFDGTIAKVEGFANGVKLGESVASPFAVSWSNMISGAYELTALATDNAGATTLSAPVNVSVSVPPSAAALRVERSNDVVAVLWPTSATALNLQSASNLSSSPVWSTLTNTPGVRSNENVVTFSNLNAQQFFRLGPEVDCSTLNRKLLMGYQGWFACAGDGSPVGSWVHWFRNNNPTATNATVDFWPDVSELDPDELFSTSMTLTNGAAARLYSAYKQKTVVRHFKWMKDNHLDGVFLQRFSSELSSGSFSALRNQVTANVRVGAETYGRAFAIMYDISGQSPSTLVSTLTNDWLYLVNTFKLTDSPQYLRHNGKPVVGIWGFGFTDRPGTPAEAQTVINFFKANGTTIMGGVPTYWRTLVNDSQSDPAWGPVYRSFDIISPWAVGRYGNVTGADNFKQDLIVPDLADATSHGLDYMPVVFPGFSWHNLNGGPLNQIPRLGGSFYWRQVYNAISAGCTMIYGAMFDEMDEGTAMLKMAPTAGELPVQGTFVPLNIDGQTLPSDWYLRVADQAGRMLRNEIPLQLVLPITP